MDERPLRSMIFGGLACPLIAASLVTISEVSQGGDYAGLFSIIFVWPPTLLLLFVAFVSWAIGEQMFKQTADEQSRRIARLVPALGHLALAAAAAYLSMSLLSDSYDESGHDGDFATVLLLAAGTLVLGASSMFWRVPVKTDPTA